MRTRINKLTAQNVAALKEVGMDGAYTATTAEWGESPGAVLLALEGKMRDLPTNEHPRKSLYAVRRKLAALIEAEEPDFTATITVTAPPPDLGIDLPAGVDLSEGSVVLFRDWDDSDVWLKVQGIEQSKEHGPSARGIEYLSERCLDSEYVSLRSLPLSQLVDREAVEEEKRERKAASRARSNGTRRVGGGVCEHCGEKTGGGRFLAGHDAKLKAELKRNALDLSVEADIRHRMAAESNIRAAQHKPEDPASSAWFIQPHASDVKRVKELVGQGDGFLRSEVARRIGADPKPKISNDGPESLKELMRL